MADPIVFGVFDAVTGAVAPAATPSIVGSVLYRIDTGATRPAPALFNRGDGQHGFTPSNADEAIGCFALLDAGVGYAFATGSRYAAVTIPEAGQLEALVLVDASDAPITLGGVVTFQSYEGTAGALTPPTLLNPIAGLYAFKPSSADVAAGVSYRLDSPAGAYPETHIGSATAPTVGPYSPPSSGTYPADAVAQMLAGTIALPDPPGGADVVLTYGAGGNLLRGPVRPLEGEHTRPAVFVLQTGGDQPQPYMGGAESWHVTRVQVTVLSDFNAFDLGEALARALLARAHINTPPGFTFALALDSDPLYLGTDEDNAHRFSFTLAVGHRR